MKKLALSLFLAVTATIAFACPAGTGDGEGEGEDGREGEGEEGEGEEGEGEEGEEGEGEEGEGEGDPPPGTCDDDADCDADETCQTLGAGAKGCYNTCTAGAACTTNLDRPGTCAAIEQGGVNFCIEVSPNLGPCGNAINATCDTQNGAPGLCLSDATGVGICARLCNPADATTCLAQGIPPAANACGCQGAELCSTDPDLGVESGDGVCTLASTVGDVCGFDAATLSLGACTDGQTCDGFNPQAGVRTGTCQLLEAGEGEGEGEGEGDAG